MVHGAEAYDNTQGQLRRKTLSSRMAQLYWNRAMFLVARVAKLASKFAYDSMFTDLQKKYVIFGHLRFYFVEVLSGILNGQCLGALQLHNNLTTTLRQGCRLPTNQPPT